MSQQLSSGAGGDDAPDADVLTGSIPVHPPDDAREDDDAGPGEDQDER